MNPRNSKTSDSHRLLLNLSDKINLKICCYMCKNTKKSYKSNKFKISAPT